jgi:hypothetical protein
MTYYVEPDYWFSGYAVGDSVPGTVLASGLSVANGTILSAGNYIAASNSGLSIATSSVLTGGNFIQTFPGINLNAKSNTFAAGAVTINSNGALIEAHSDSRMTGRPFWENTQPASGTWTIIVPQAEGSGP